MSSGVIRYHAVEGIFGQRAFELLINNADHGPSQVASAVVDLSRITNINAVGLVNLTLLLGHLLSSGKSTKLILPRQKHVRNRIITSRVIEIGREIGRSRASSANLRVGLLRAIHRTGSVPDAPVPQSRVLRLNDRKNAYQIAVPLLGYLRERSSYRSTDISRVCQVVTELSANIEDHSMAPETAVGAYELYDGDPPRIILAFGDLGIGINERLRRTNRIGPNKSDIHALEVALREGESSVDESGRGGGLALCRKYARELGFGFGLRSGTAYYLIFRSRQRFTPVSFFPGTQAYFGFIL